MSFLYYYTRWHKIVMTPVKEKIILALVKIRSSSAPNKAKTTGDLWVTNRVRGSVGGSY